MLTDTATVAVTEFRVNGHLFREGHCAQCGEAMRRHFDANNRWVPCADSTHPLTLAQQFARLLEVRRG